MLASYAKWYSFTPPHWPNFPPPLTRGGRRSVLQLSNTPKPKPRWDVHLGGLEDELKDSTAPHITFMPNWG